jgi:hypothetical protein
MDPFCKVDAITHVLCSKSALPLSLNPACSILSFTRYKTPLLNRVIDSGKLLVECQ